MTAPDDVATALRCYPASVRLTEIEPLGNAGGFSGARFWRVPSDRGLLCLRRWPPAHPDQARLRYIHAVLLHTAGSGSPVPAPLETLTGESWVCHGGTFWEVTPWLSGQPSFRDHPSRARLDSAMQTLARFHQNAATVHECKAQRSGRAPAVVERLEQLNRLVAGQWERIARAADQCPATELRTQSRRIGALFPTIALRLAQELREAVGNLVPLQPSIRDVWHDHVLYTGDQVTGLIDFGAMRQDSVAVDLARLIGSLVDDQTELRQFALDCYQRVRPLQSPELRLVDVLDHTAVLLGSINWLRWICADGREFESPQLVQQRLEELASRLESIAAGSAGRQL